MIKNRNGQIFLRNFFLLWASLLFIAGTCSLRNKNPREGQELPENVLNRRSQRGNQEQREKKDQQKDYCVICMHQMDGEGESECSKVTLPQHIDQNGRMVCGHAFCLSCLCRSIKMRPVCPICRTTINEAFIKKIKNNPPWSDGTINNILC